MAVGWICCSVWWWVYAEMDPNKRRLENLPDAYGELLKAAKTVVRVASYKTLAITALSEAIGKVEEADEET